MKRVSEILKDCDIRKVLCCLTEGIPENTFDIMLERYYSLYRMVSELQISDKSNEVILTGFRQTERQVEHSLYTFFGIYNASDMHSLLEDERPVKWEEVLKRETVCLIPKCLVEAAGEELLTTEILLQIEKVNSARIRKRRNSKLFKYVREATRSGKSKLYVAEKTLETALSYQVDHRLIENAVFEYSESKFPLIKWGKILEERESSFVKHLISDLKGKEMLARQLLSGSLVSAIDTPAYKWFIKMDPENVPDICRCYNRLNILRACYNELGFSDYQDVEEEHLRIVIEHNPSNDKFPIIYVRNKYGEKIEFSESEIGLSRLLSMDIYVTDSKISDQSQVLAMLAFYMEYPLRVKRIQRKYMLFALIGMMHMRDIDTVRCKELD